MVTEMITLKLERKFLVDIDKTVKEKNYQNRTEFIRAALRDKVDQEKLKKTMQELAHLKGASKKVIGDDLIEKGREVALKRLEKRVKSVFQDVGI